MKVRIETVPHGAQRYSTVGDWLYDDDGTLVVRVSEGLTREQTACVAIHELVEAVACARFGVAENVVTMFDIAFENARCPNSTDEPGDCPDAPYYFAHQGASAVERVVGYVLGVHWPTYEKAMDALDAQKEESQ